MAATAISGNQRRRLWTEAILVFGALPCLATIFVPPGLLIPVLWCCGLVARLVLQRSPGFDRTQLHTLRHARLHLPAMLGRFAIAATIMIAALYYLYPQLLFSFPRSNPRAWLLVMCLYPLLSVYPQALIFRALFVERYARIFASERTTLVVGALCFCLAHLPFRNLWALGFTCIGGFFFLRTYLRSKSLLLSCLEHALYGQMLFTVGWGAFLYHGGTQALLRSG